MAALTAIPLYDQKSREATVRIKVLMPQKNKRSSSNLMRLNNPGISLNGRK